MLRGDFAMWTHCQAMNTRPLCAHTHSPESRLLSRMLPSPQPCCRAVSPDAPVLQLLFLLTSLPWNTRQELLPLPTTLRQRLGALAGHGSICHLRAEAQGSLLCRCQVPARQQRAEPSAVGGLRARWPPRCDLLVTVQLQDGALQGMHGWMRGCRARKPQQGCTLHTGGTVAAAQ